MTSRKKDDPELKLAITSAKWKAAAAVHCAAVLRPDLDESALRELANGILTLGDRQGRTIPRQRITNAQAIEMVWANMQCIAPNCPLLVFGNQLAYEINEFFSEDR